MQCRRLPQTTFARLRQARRASPNAMTARDQGGEVQFQTAFSAPTVCSVLTTTLRTRRNLPVSGLEPIGDTPQAKFEAMHYEGQEGSAKKIGPNEKSLRERRGRSLP